MGDSLEPIRLIFADEVLAAWREEFAFPPLRERLDVLAATGPFPSELGPRLRVRELRCRRAAWETYVDAAQALDVMHFGRLARLRASDDEEFRTAMAECLTAWFFAGPLKWQVMPQPLATGRPLEMRIPGRKAEVEVAVRVPFLGRPVRRIASVDDLDLLLHEVRSASHQFSDGGPNLLVIAPGLSSSAPGLPERMRLLRAVRQNRPSLWRPDFATFGALGPPLPTPLSDGRFLKQWAERGWLPDRARVSAIIYIEERLVERHPFPWGELFFWSQTRSHRDAQILARALDRHHSTDRAVNPAYIGHHVLIVHNPHADHAIDVEPFGGFTQLRPETGKVSRLRKGPRMETPIDLPRDRSSRRRAHRRRPPRK